MENKPGFSQENTIERLNEQLAAKNKELEAIKGNLRTAWGLVFMTSDTIKQATEKLNKSSNYTFYNGEIANYIHVDFSEFDEAQEYLKEYLNTEHFVDIDFNNDTLFMRLGENLIIQDGSRDHRDNGVWLDGKRVIPESDYVNHNCEVDEQARNRLIEEYMEKTGFFPGVFRVDYHGNIFPVNTRESK